MASEAALSGIVCNGLQWQRRLDNKVFIPDDVPSLSDRDIPAIASIIQKHLHQKLALLKMLEVGNPTGIDFEEAEGIEIENCKTGRDLAIALTELYDWADFWRVLIC